MFDPLAGQGEGQFFLSLRVNSCADSFVSDPPSCQCTAPTQICAYGKDAKSICRKRVGLTEGGMETRKHCTLGDNKLGSAVPLWLLDFPRDSSPNFPCIALGQESYLI